MITIEEIKEANRDRSERWGMFNPDTQVCCHRPTNPETRHLIEFWYHAGLFTALGPDEYTALLESMSPAMLSGLTCATEVRLGPGNWNGEESQTECLSAAFAFVNYMKRNRSEEDEER